MMHYALYPLLMSCATSLTRFQIVLASFVYVLVLGWSIPGPDSAFLPPFRQRARLSAERCAVSRTRALAVRKAPGKVSDPATPDGSLLPDGQLATVHRPVARWEPGLCQRLVSQSFWEQNLKSQPSGAWVTWSIHSAR